MQVTLQQIEPCKVAVTVEVDADTVRETVDRVFAEVAAKVSVPGFRKGKAPRSILERYVDHDVVRERAARKLVPEYLERALLENSVEAVALPELDIEELRDGEPLRFTATVPTRPEVRLCDYRGLVVQRRGIKVTEADIDQELERMRWRHAVLVDAEEETAGPGMVAVVDLDVYRGDRQLKNRSRSDVNVNMDDTHSVPALNLAIEGARIGEVREMPVRYPAGHQDPVLAGKEVTFRIHVKALKKLQQREIDDEFAREVAGVENVAAWREKVRAQLEQAAQEVANREVREQLLEQVVSRSEVHFPDALVQQQVAQVLRSRIKELEEQGTSLDSFLRARQMDLAAFEQEIREDTRRRIRTRLVVEQIASEAGITVTEQEMRDHLNQMLEAAGVSVEIRGSVMQGRRDWDGLRLPVLFEKVLNFLQESARIVDA